MPMTLHDYTETDKEDYYAQGFERTGYVSLWVGLADQSTAGDEIDVLQDLCGVGYYNLDSQESNCHEFRVVSVVDLLGKLSYSPTFQDEAVKAAADKGVMKGRWVVAQYDFAYDPGRVKRTISSDPVFLGVFPYSRDDD